MSGIFIQDKDLEKAFGDNNVARRFYLLNRKTFEEGNYRNPDDEFVLGTKDFQTQKYSSKSKRIVTDINGMKLGNAETIKFYVDLVENAYNSNLREGEKQKQDIPVLSEEEKQKEIIPVLGEEEKQGEKKEEASITPASLSLGLTTPSLSLGLTTPSLSSGVKTPTLRGLGIPLRAIEEEYSASDIDPRSVGTDIGSDLLTEPSIPRIVGSDIKSGSSVPSPTISGFSDSNTIDEFTYFTGEVVNQQNIGANIKDTLEGTKNSGKYKDAVHPDALSIFFGSSTDPDWDDYLLQERYKKWNTPELRNANKAYVYNQSKMIVEKKGIEILVNSLFYGIDSDADLIFKENHEILQLYMSLTNNRRGSDKKKKGGENNEGDELIKGDPPTMYEEDSEVVGYHNEKINNPNIANENMFNRPPEFLDKKIMSEISPVERQLLNGSRPLSRMKYYKGRTVFAFNREEQSNFESKLLRGSVIPNNIEKETITQSFKGYTNIMPNSNLGIKINNKKSSFKI
jgi:hypothetical protein